MVIGAIVVVLLLIAAFKLWDAARNPVLCAGLVAIPRMFLNLIVGAPVLNTLLGTALIFGWIWLYFCLLDRRFGPTLHWLIFFAGVLITVVLHVVL